MFPLLVLSVFESEEDRVCTGSADAQLGILEGRGPQKWTHQNLLKEDKALECCFSDHKWRK